MVGELFDRVIAYLVIIFVVYSSLLAVLARLHTEVGLQG